MGYTVSKLLVDAKDPRRNEYDENMRQYIGGVCTPNEYSGGGNTSCQGISGSVGISGSIGIQGQSGYPNTVFKNDVHLDNMSLKDFVHNVPVQSIENSVVTILKKYGFIVDGTTNFTHDATVGYPHNSWMNTEDEELNDDESGDEYEEEDEYEDEEVKTFTLDEIINTIESLPIKMNLNHGGIWESSHDQLISKQSLIEKFKSL